MLRDRSRPVVVCRRPIGTRTGRNRGCNAVTTRLSPVPPLAPVLPIPPGVNFWIGVAHEDGRRRVRLAGQLGDAQVPEFLLACDASAVSGVPGRRAQGEVLEIDLTELVSADVAGIEALRRVRAGGATLVGASGYIQLKLDARP